MERLITAPVSDVDPAAVLLWLESPASAAVDVAARELIRALAQELIRVRLGEPDPLGREDLWTAEV